MADNGYQLDLFNSVRPYFKIDKPIRLIELFAGIGAQAKALEILGVPFEHWKICEWAANSIKSYNAIHIKDFTDYSKGKAKEELIDYLQGNISTNYNDPCNVAKKNEEWLRDIYNNVIATHNLMNIMKVSGKDLQIVDTNKYCYIMTYSFPCQDLSLAGKRQGMAVSQADGGTRSGLLWEVERILTELHTHTQSSTLPQVLLMENVPEVIGVGNVKHFNKWLDKLESLGYTNHFQILNGKDYGIPQNRRRVFMVSILGDYAYDFPIKLKLKYRLKDFLEKKVDEKYYLSDKDIERISSWDSYEKPIENAIDVDDKSRDSQIVPTLTTHVGKDSAGMKLIKVGNYGNGFFSKNVYDSEGVSPTLTCGNHGLGTAITDKTKKSSGGGLHIMENTKQGYKIAQPGDGVNLASRMKHQRGNVQRGSIQTLKTEMEIGVVVDDEQK